ncbi:Stk1 family PASTA domain-containing Ser/Thr kinase [Clostridium sp. CS001]|uniref:Stk1 family PASTA domain-containing Ser/Thr kinase n=1 Tax=Clostridium sp. CS001 TaxID=2880648 RepID=UPI001CF47691|nr:Stk1 family PASTA domain-containing Ser/Thr kinase [Clostridium sp. CS001]MCB2289656.1 Stk1 family PASTA domain-containing Ser/Thr kinase [Clostridium sp. CS001]
MVGKLFLNRYELLEKIGEGGMGVVYKAKCHLLNRFVAVKILKAELNNDEEFVARFKREGISVAKLSHPNIVNVHDVGIENNINFMVMEYIKGKTLKQVIKEDIRLSADRTLEITLQIAKALECAHKNNIIHRDIKPDNILITEDNVVKVMDFGIAKVLDSQTVTNSNKVIGTAHYFSPEQAKGNFVDGRTDIYSLGIVMYEMVTGKVPYNADSAISIAMMHIQKPAIPPKEVILDLPQNINQLILKALDKEPINRFQTATEMVEILNLIKVDPDFMSNNIVSDATKLMDKVVASDVASEFTTVMSEAAGAPKEPVIKNYKKILKGKKGPSNNKRIMIVMASIILVMIIGGLGKYISKITTDNTPTIVAKTTLPKVSEKLPIDEKKLVPSLIGNTQDIATQTITDNGFLLGNISSEYSDIKAKGLVISQLPKVNTPYEKHGKVDLIISQGKKIVQVAVPQLNEKNLDEAEIILNGLKLKLGVARPVDQDKKDFKGKKSKGKKSKDYEGQIFMQDIEAGTLVDVGTEINVSYYED